MCMCWFSLIKKSHGRYFKMCSHCLQMLSAVLHFLSNQQIAETFDRWWNTSRLPQLLANCDGCEAGSTLHLTCLPVKTKNCRPLHGNIIFHNMWSQTHVYTAEQLARCSDIFSTDKTDNRIDLHRKTCRSLPDTHLHFVFVREREKGRTFVLPHVCVCVLTSCHILRNMSRAYRGSQACRRYSVGSLSP